MTQMIGKATVVNLRTLCLSYTIMDCQCSIKYVNMLWRHDLSVKSLPVKKRGRPLQTSYPLTIDSTENDIIDTCTCQEAQNYPRTRTYENKNTKIYLKALQPFIRKFAQSKISRYTVSYGITCRRLHYPTYAHKDSVWQCVWHFCVINIFSPPLIGVASQFTCFAQNCVYQFLD